MSDSMGCGMCRYYSALREPREREDGAVIYGYCFATGTKDYNGNMGKGYAVFVPDSGVCEKFKRIYKKSEKAEESKRQMSLEDLSIERLKSENAELKSSLTHAPEECLKWHERAQNLLKDSGGSISRYEKKISALQAENAALRERLDKAVELPVKVGDTVWLVGYIHVSADAHLQCIEAKITDLMMMKDLVRYGAQEGDWCHEFTNDAIGEWVFMTREAALARLAEPKGEKNE